MAGILPVGLGIAPEPLGGIVEAEKEVVLISQLIVAVANCQCHIYDPTNKKKI